MASLLAAINGGVSGFFGLAALPIELPVTTTLMLRAIADTARHQGEDLTQLEARLACLEVFALGAGNSVRRIDVGYFASRTYLSKLAFNASLYLAERSVPGTSAPVVNNNGTLGDNAREWVARDRTWAHNAARYRDAYARLGAL